MILLQYPVRRRGINHTKRPSESFTLRQESASANSKACHLEAARRLIRIMFVFSRDFQSLVYPEQLEAKPSSLSVPSRPQKARSKQAVPKVIDI